MPTVKPIHGISHDKGGIAAARRLGRRATKIETAAGDVYLRQADRLIDPVQNSEIGGVELRIRCDARRKAIEARARLVDDVGAESVCLIQGEDLPQSAAGVTKPRDGVTRPGRLGGLCVLNGVVAVQPVAFTQIVVDVRGPLIDVDRRARRADEARRAGRVDKVRSRDQIDQSR